MYRILCEEACPYQGLLIRCQSYLGDYACSFGEAAMSCDDRTDSSTQVPAALPYHVRHSMPLSLEDPTLVALPSTKSPRVRLLRTWVHFEPGHEAGLQGTNR
jgi:hypothetical protein